MLDNIDTNYGLLTLLALALLIIIGRRRRKLRYLRNKYGDETIVQRIMAHQFWQGQTSEQLRDSLGEPVASDVKLLKNKERKTWKYNRRGRGRYDLRITVENGIVIGWDQKSE